MSHQHSYSYKHSLSGGCPVHDRRSDNNEAPAETPIRFPTYVPADAIAEEMANDARREIAGTQEEIKKAVRGVVVAGGADLVGKLAARLQRLKRKALGEITAAGLKTVVRRHHEDIWDFQKEQMIRKAQREFDVEPVFRDRKATSLIDIEAERAAGRIHWGVEKQYDDVLNGLSDLSDTTDLRTAWDDGKVQQITNHELGKAENQIEFSAWDGAGNSMSKAQRSRNSEMGVTHYYWVSMGDKRVRVVHQRANGNRFPWRKRPRLTGGHPGEPPRCRCGSEPDLTTTSPANMTTTSKLGPRQRVEPVEEAPDLLNTNRTPDPIFPSRGNPDPPLDE